MRLKDTTLEINSDGMAKFSVNMVGGKTMQTYLGNFKAKCLLNANEYIRANREFMDLIGDSKNLGDPEEIAFALVQLKYRLVDVPPFWQSQNSPYDGGEIKDYNIITSVFNICMDAEREYEKMMQEDYDKVKEKIKKQREALVKKKEKDESEDKEK